MLENQSLHNYAASRERLLENMVAYFIEDNDIIAAWLTGSLVGGKEDTISDIDLTVVLTNEAAEIMCKRPFQQGGQTPPERLEFFERFGRSAIVHENHNNAPPEGTFTFVQYESALSVDWILVPHSKARRLLKSQLLFEKMRIPVEATAKPLGTAERAKIASEKAAFFWMMACVIVKYIVREDTLLFNSWLDELHWMVNDVEGLVSNQEPEFDPQKRLPLALTVEEQKEALRDVCILMDRFGTAIVELGGYVPEEPISAVEKRLSICDNSW